MGAGGIEGVFGGNWIDVGEWTGGVRVGRIEGTGLVN